MRRAFVLGMTAAVLFAGCGGGFTKLGDGGSGGQGDADGGSDNSAGSATRGGSSGGGNECKSSTDCPQPGAPCQPCADGSYACPTVQCIAGECVGSFPTCMGAACTQDGECPQSDAPCHMCSDGTTACPWSRCENGACVSGIDSCDDADPCAGKSCGDTCSSCPPGANCPDVLMYCDEKLICQYDEPACGGTGCMDDTDCPAVELCAPCPDTEGSCAEMRCLSGECRLQCPGGMCSAQGDSCANGEACCAGLECCAGVPTPPGEEYCSSNCPISDRNLKRDFASVDREQILKKVVELPLSTWSYKSETSGARHIGPMAQDFMQAFGVGSDERTILQVDADGVQLAAIQALHARLEKLERRNNELEQELRRLQRERR